MMKFTVVAALFGAAYALDGTCTAGLDPVGVEQSCLGRCHIYYVGDFGACFNFQFSDADVNGPCGDTPANACKSTFNVAWDTALANCGNCYFVELPYADGTVRSTYIQVVDTNSNEVKFEMGQQAWRNLCPYVCAGTGDCGHSPESCVHGVLEDSPAWNGNVHCAVQHAPINFRRVECDSEELIHTTAFIHRTVTVTATTEPPVQNTIPPVVLPPVLNPTTAPPATTTTEPPVQNTIPPVVLPPVLNPTTAPPATTTTEPPVQNTIPPAVLPTPPVLNPSTAPPVTENIGEACGAGIGHPSIPDWHDECKVLCHFYLSEAGRPHCPTVQTADELIDCVIRQHSWCQRM